MAFPGSAICLLVLLVASVTGLPSTPDAQHVRLQVRQDSSIASPPYSLPQNDPNPTLRAAGIATKRATFLYGAGEGGGPYSPSGPLGAAYIAADSAIVNLELGAQAVLDTNDTAVATLDSPQYQDLQTLDDYVELYNREWEPSSAPTGIDPGMLTNYTQDLLFSMERLSFNPFAVRRLIPGKDELPFTIDNPTITNVSGSSLSTLLDDGRLFYVDHSSQVQLERTERYSAACDAYFYITPSSGDFLPLAIRTNYGEDLIYTPADTANDWLLAKMMFNVNDFFMGQFHHLANTHYVIEIIYEAAVRTLSDDHPVLAVLARLLYGEFGIRPLAVSILFSPGGACDEFFPWTGTGCSNFSEEVYNNGYAGAIQSNYFLTNLQNRGLINSSVGPPLKDFPFYEDALPIYNSIHAFMSTLVNTYYATPAALEEDSELQAWLAEANGPAEAIDFPTSSSLSTPAQLVDLLTHVAHLASSAHHAVNTNQLLTGSGVLPFHPGSLYKQVPTAKGAEDLASYLPPVVSAIGSINVQADFARPLLAYTNRTIVHMFDDEDMLERMPPALTTANEQFMQTLLVQSQAVQQRGFDEQGLSQGMPFVWKALDPNVAPWSTTV